MNIYWKLLSKTTDGDEIDVFEERMQELLEAEIGRQELAERRFFKLKGKDNEKMRLEVMKDV